MRVLVLSAHPDDETIGMGGTIAKLASEGHEVHLSVLTSSFPPLWPKEEYEVRRRQCLAAAKVLGIKQTHFLDYPTTMTDTVPQNEINTKIAEIVKQVDPSVVYAPTINDIHIDHRHLSLASFISARPYAKVGGPTTLYFFEVPISSDWGGSLYGSTFTPNTFVDIEGFLQTKLAAFKEYELENREPPHPRSSEFVENWARFRGGFVGLMYAEAFQLVYNILR